VADTEKDGLTLSLLEKLLLGEGDTVKLFETVLVTVIVLLIVGETVTLGEGVELPDMLFVTVAETELLLLSVGVTV
jgi:hypothetical protein